MNGGVSLGMKVGCITIRTTLQIEISTTDLIPSQTDLFAKDAESPSLVEVAAKAYRRVALYEPGEYEATLTYYDGSETKATWLVRDLSEERRAKNVLMFIGDGMTTNMITAARLIAHKAVNGKYQTKMVSPCITSGDGSK